MHFAGMARSYYTTGPGVKGGSGPYRDMRGNYPKQPFGAEPGGGVRNREQGANCLSAASFCPAGSAARRPGSSQRQGCPFFWFFSLGRQRKERHPAGGRWHFGGAGGFGRIRLRGCRGLEGRGLGCRGLGCRGACGALFVFWWDGFAGTARSYRRWRAFRRERGVMA